MFLAVESCFIINLRVLSSVLYRWRSLEATVREGLKPRGRRLNSRSLEYQRTPDSREHQQTKAHPKVSKPTLKPSSTEGSSSSARHTMLILQQNRNTTQNIKRQAAQSHATPIATPKLTIRHFIAPERRDRAPPTRTHTILMNQENLTNHWSNPTHGK